MVEVKYSHTDCNRLVLFFLLKTCLYPYTALNLSPAVWSNLFFRISNTRI